ncbi:vacuolar ATP synthase subunit f, partial [Plasmodium yoelii yoelii]
FFIKIKIIIYSQLYNTRKALYIHKMWGLYKKMYCIHVESTIADEIRHLVDLHDKILPTVLEIPSKDKPFDPNKDSIIQRVKLFFGGDISNIK